MRRVGFFAVGVCLLPVAVRRESRDTGPRVVVAPRLRAAFDESRAGADQDRTCDLPGKTCFSRAPERVPSFLARTR
jgi:hypothetical protein